MKTIKTPVEIPATPARQTTRTEYACDVPNCAFATTDHAAAEKHEGVHAATAKRVIGDKTYYYLPTKAAAEAHCKTFYDKDGHDGWRNYWTNPGWYLAGSDSSPCGSGCCTRYYYELTPASGYLDELRRVAESATELATLLDAAPKEVDRG